MKTWIASCRLACATEILFIAVLITTTRTVFENSIYVRVIGWYHIFSLWFGYAILTVWKSGPRSEAASLTGVIYWMAVYVAQAAVITPIFVGIATVSKGRREHP